MQPNIIMVAPVGKTPDGKAPVGTAFVDFYQSLVLALGESATVYVPLPVIAPNERRALPPPDHVLISLPSTELFHVVYQEMHKYLNWQTETKLTIENGGQVLSLSYEQLPDESTLREALFAGK